MTDNAVPIPCDLWRELKDFFSRLSAPCRDCLRGTPRQCFESRCAAFQFRQLARRVEGVSDSSLHIRLPRHVQIENEILSILSRVGKPVYPSQIVLNTTNSKANKCNAIDRLIRQGAVVEHRINDYTRMISLPHERNPKNEQEPTSSCGATRRAPAYQLGAGDAGARTDACHEQPVRPD